ncbi:MAG: RagB/SusD family nutrient uptake outer membrane protein [Prevotellaceae bacterium]|jgi:hypothetical protein|nr:RagB/SusD family nutrient uptake outer membrane protein [Prevotellaceae bacterium]
MKKNLFSALALGAVLSLASCNNLDLDPLDSLDQELFFGSDQDAILAINGVYAALVESESVVVAWCVGLGSDEAQNGESNGDGSGAELSAMQFNPGTAQHIYWVWGDHYYGIANATALIDKLNDPATPVSDAIRKRVRGEAEFLRAYYYHAPVQIFGDVPLVIQSGYNAGVGVERDDVHKVYAQIVKDLEDAATDLAEYPDNDAYGLSDKGRVTQGSAYGQLAKVYLVWAQTEGATDVDGKYAKAIEYADKVVGYSLEAKFHSNWEKDNRYGKETLFAANYVLSQESFGDGGNHLTHCAFSSGFSQQTPHVVLSDRTYYDRFDNRDQRKEATFLSHAINPETNQDFVFDMPRYAKNIDLDEPLTSSKSRELQAPILRYAEVLLTKAEAEIERSGGNLSNARDAINEVRRRAYRVDIYADPANPNGLTIADADIPATATQAELRKALRRERLYELTYEQNRWFDLVRWKVLVKTVKRVAKHNADGYTTASNYASAQQNVAKKSNVSSKNYRFPIPQSQRNLNSKLTQNWGYEGSTAATPPYADASYEGGADNNDGWTDAEIDVLYNNISLVVTHSH